MADLQLATRAPLAHLAGPSRLGGLGEEPGVTFREERGLALTLLVAGRNQVADMRRAVQGIGVTLPTGPTFERVGDGMVLWAGPEQWLLVNGSSASAQADGIMRACSGLCMTVDLSDARAVVAIAGQKSRDVLAKAAGIDLHPRVFSTGSTALTPLFGVGGQIWQNDSAPEYLIAIPRSYAESLWHWLLDAAAEYGYAVIE